MFDSRFEVFLADTSLSHRLHYQIRYRVFCLDNGFEDLTTAVLGEEKDRWDDQSRHFLVREKSTGQWVATMRMILPEAKPFPVESLCNLSFSNDISYKQDVSSEISRLCMVRRYRGRQAISAGGGNTLYPQNEDEGVGRRAEPEIMLGLFRAALTYSRQHGILQWYFLITPALAKMIQRIGVSLQPLGPAVEHRGKRIPYVTDPFSSCRESMEKSPIIARMFSDESHAYTRFSEIKPEHKVA